MWQDDFCLYLPILSGHNTRLSNKYRIQGKSWQNEHSHNSFSYMLHILINEFKSIENP